MWKNNAAGTCSDVVPSYIWSSVVRCSFGDRCFFCGSTERVEAHHIKPRALYPELKNSVSNGVALCHNCHLKAHGGNFYNVEEEQEQNCTK